MKKISKKTFFKRILITTIVLILLFIISIIRLGYVQFFKSEEFINRAYDLWTRSIPVEAKRGNIYDRNGKLIVGNKLSPTVMIIPGQIEDKEYTINTLSTILNVQDMNSFKKHFEKNVSVERIKPEGSNISIDQTKLIISKNLKGVYIAADTQRYYPYGKSLCHTLGIVGSDNVGLSGLEYIYNDYLLGKKGATNIFTDAHGKLYEDITKDYDTSTSGLDLYLTINIDIQNALERVLDNAEAVYKVDDAVGIVMDPNTSEILAISSRPNFDITNYQDYSQEFYNRNLPIWKSYEPGSVQKIVTFSACIEEGLLNLNDHFYCKGYEVIDGIRIRDWKAGGHGSQTWLVVLQNSCNPGFMNLGLRIGKEKLFEYIRKFGFGTKTGIDLLGESTGILFNEEKIGNVELVTSAFGQGNSVTPIQLINASSCAVNGGILNTPYILKGFGINGSIIYQNKTKFIRQVISPETSKKVASSLEHVVALGTGRGAYIDGYRVGGKTGTAQVPIAGGYADNEFILSFLGISPMNNPQVACYIALENAKDTIQYGGTVVAPMVKEVLTEAITILNIPKQDNQIDRLTRYWVDKFIYTVDNYIGRDTSSITISPYYKFKIIGNGTKIINQLPAPGEKIIQDGYVTLYTN